MRSIITRGLYIFYPIFNCGLYERAVYITVNLCTNNGNSSYLKLKIRGLHTRAVTDQEWVIVARVQYVIFISINIFRNVGDRFYHQNRTLADSNSRTK